MEYEYQYWLNSWVPNNLFGMFLWIIPIGFLAAQFSPTVGFKVRLTLGFLIASGMLIALERHYLHKRFVFIDPDVLQIKFLDDSIRTLPAEELREVWAIRFHKVGKCHLLIRLKDEDLRSMTVHEGNRNCSDDVRILKNLYKLR